MIQIQQIGYQFVNLNGFDVVREKGSGNFLFLYFRCETEVFLNGTYETVPENTFLLYKKDAPQIYRKKDGHFINDWIHFDITPYDDYFEKLNIPFQTPIRLPESKEITDMISDLYMEFFHVGQQHEAIMDQKANALFHRFSDLNFFVSNNGVKKADFFRQLTSVRMSLQNYEYRPDSVKDIANVLNISVSYLQHMYKEFFGTSVQHDIIHGKLEYASRLLSGTDDTIGEIASLCGYENMEHFSRQFKKYKGCSPIQYRKNRLLP